MAYYQPQPYSVSRVFSPGEQAAPTASRTVDKRKTVILGILQMISGALGLVFGILLLIHNRTGQSLLLDNLAGGLGWVKFVGLGITVWVFASGIFGIISACHKTSRSLNMANTIFAMLSIIGTIVGFGLFLALLKDNSCDYINDVCYRQKTRHTYFVLLLTLFVTECIVSIFVAIYGFRSDLFVCCMNENEKPRFQRTGEIPGLQMAPIFTQYAQPQSTVQGQGLPPAYTQTVPQITTTTTPPKSENCLPPLPPCYTP